MKIIYSDEAIFSLEEVVKFLIDNWTHIELDVFEFELENFLENINDEIITYPKVDGFKNLHFALIGNKQVKVYFFKNDQVLEIILFLPSKANPNRLKYLFKIN